MLKNVTLHNQNIVKNQNEKLPFFLISVQQLYFVFRRCCLQHPCFWSFLQNHSKEFVTSCHLVSEKM